MLVAMASPKNGATLIVVGDVHRHWRPADHAFLERGDQDLVAFVGDLGDEDAELVQQVAELDVDKVVILGNHDAWQSFTRRRPTKRLLDSLASLKDDHLAYSVRELPAAGVSLVGARPFSWGGPSLRSPELYDRLFKVRDMAASAERILAAATRAQHRDLIILAHNGPTGLSRDPQDIWGKDFGQQIGGDWGDPDLQMALERIAAAGWRVPCVIAGHMHHRTTQPRGELRTRFLRRNGTLYVNPAVVPRIRALADGTEVAHYLRMTWCQGQLEACEEIWVDEAGAVREVLEPELAEV